MSVDVLAVVAHPDDEAIGCGGTLAKMARLGHTTRVLLPLRRCDPRGVATWDALLAAFARSCEALGAEPVVLDAPLDETRAESDVHLLHDAILPYVEEADLVLSHWPGDANQVHRGLARAVEIATRPFRRRRDVLLFEVATSTDQAFARGGAPPFVPDCHVLLAPEDGARKLAAVDAYAAEAAPGRTPLDVERRMRLRGTEVGVERAEALATARRFL